MERVLPPRPHLHPLTHMTMRKAGDEEKSTQLGWSFDTGLPEGGGIVDASEGKHLSPLCRLFCSGRVDASGQSPGTYISLQRLP